MPFRNYQLAPVLCTGWANIRNDQSSKHRKLVHEPLTWMTKTPTQDTCLGPSGQDDTLTKSSCPNSEILFIYFLISRMFKWPIASETSCLQKTAFGSQWFWSCFFCNHCFCIYSKVPGHGKIVFSSQNLSKKRDVESSHSRIQDCMSNVKPYQTFKATCEPLTLGN